MTLKIVNNDVITRHRGDRAAYGVLITDNLGVAKDITGWSFTLTVNALEDPVAQAALFTSTGTITDATAGEVEFPFSVSDADQTPATYFYDIEAKDTASLPDTLAKGKWVVLQDITK